MDILSIKRVTKPSTGLKVYGKVKGDSGKVYNFGYFRRANFRGWLCSCVNFVLEQRGKNRNCKHIKLVRATYGRFATKVQ